MKIFMISLIFMLFSCTSNKFNYVEFEKYFQEKEPLSKISINTFDDNITSQELINKYYEVYNYYKQKISEPLVYLSEDTLGYPSINVIWQVGPNYLVMVAKYNNDNDLLLIYKVSKLKTYSDKANITDINKVIDNQRIQW